jgi:hypothetical protein
VAAARAGDTASELDQVAIPATLPVACGALNHPTAPSSGRSRAGAERARVTSAFLLEDQGRFARAGFDLKDGADG